MRAHPRHLSLIAAGMISLASLAVVARAPAQDTAASGPTGVSGATSTSGSSGTSGGGAATGLPTRIVRLPPATLSSGVADLTIKLNGSTQGGGPDPTLEPNVPGTWTSWGQNETFKPTSSFAPCGTYTLTIPAGTAAAGESSLGKSQDFSFTIACPGVKALQEALARLGYLPYRLESFAGVDLNVPLTTGMAAARAYALPAGWLRREYREAPALDVGTMDPSTTGALWVWEQDHDIPVGTQPDGAIWRTLVREEALDHANPRPYTWVTVTENTSPELLKVHEGRHVVITSPTNTGIPGRTTQTGEFPIYVRYVATTMSGTNPDGSHYDDPGVPWVNYFNGGDAVHGFPRASYGSPQSLGCVELPIPTAEKVYDQLAVGDMVDVSD